MSKKVEYQDLLDAGVHFGHLTRKWNPQMAPYIFMEKNDIHIIDLNKTKACLEDAQAAMKNIVKSGRKVLFVATKKQAREVVSDEAKRLKMPFVTERWLGGMLTNFLTVKKSLKKMSSIDKLMKDEAFNALAKKERLMITREREKLEKLLGGITELTRLPAALFIIDAKKEHIAVAEARRLNIPVFAVVDTNTNPNNIDYPIPGNDDAYKSISILTKSIGNAIEEALDERKRNKEEEDKEEVAAEDEKPKKKAKASEEE
jgi:small subunit ribosomal protein S2